MPRSPVTDPGRRRNSPPRLAERGIWRQTDEFGG